MYGSLASSSAGLRLRLVDAAGEQLAVLDDLAHPLLERLQIIRGERLGDIEVVVEAVRDRRPDSELGVGKHVLHRLREHMGGRVADDTAAIFGVRSDGHDLRVGTGRPAQVPQPAVGVANDDDRVRLTAARQAGIADRAPGGRPGRHPDPGGEAEGVAAVIAKSPRFLMWSIADHAIGVGSHGWPGRSRTNSASPSASTAPPSVSRP